MKLFTIWDMDNCLADDLWRQQYIEWGKQGDDRYRAYNERLLLDAPAHLREFELYMKIGAEPVFFTGRSEYLRPLTYDWIDMHLSKFGVKPRPTMYMRPNDHRATPRDLKEEMLTRMYREHLGFGNRIIGAFDDLPPVVQMYRNHNIPSAQLAIHAELSGAYSPADLKL
jgi:hypothetical protein